jgi:hypothetical protein
VKKGHPFDLSFLIGQMSLQPFAVTNSMLPFLDDVKVPPTIPEFWTTFCALL